MNLDRTYNRTLLIDGSYQLHRALSVPNQYEMKTTTGISTGGVYGVLKIIQKELKTYNYYPIVVFDGGLASYRLNLYPNYKKAAEKHLLLENKCTDAKLAQLEFMQEYKNQRQYLIELLPLIGIPCLKYDDWEGDDLLYILSLMSNDSIVVSDDKDLLQLLSGPNLNNDRRCRIRRALNDEFWDDTSLKQLEVDNIPDYISRKAIIGDPSDNIPSACDGVGEKTAINLVKILNYTRENGLKYPENEKELESICESLNIGKRKAYLNFNYDQFKTNYLLTDLSQIDYNVDEEFIRQINNDIHMSYIESTTEVTDEKLRILMEKLEFYSVDIPAIRSRLNYLLPVLKYDNHINVKNFPEINQIKSTLF